jgi:hypothetical protein
MAAQTAVRVVDNPAFKAPAEVLPFPLPLSSRAIAAARARRAEDAVSEERFEEIYALDEVPTATGCMRGLRYALALEATAGLVIWGAWHLVRMFF